MSFDEEQKQILKLVDKYCKDLGKSWSKFKGETVCRIVQSFIDKHLSNSLRTVRSNVYVKDFPQEFDMLIVDFLAKPIELTNSFEPKKVHSILEIKKSGVYSDSAAQCIKKNFEEITSKHPHIKCAYLTIEEVYTTVRKGAKNFYNDSKKEISPHGFFALRDLRGKKDPIQGQWEQFIKFVT